MCSMNSLNEILQCSRESFSALKNKAFSGEGRIEKDRIRIYAEKPQVKKKASKKQKVLSGDGKSGID